MSKVPFLLTAATVCFAGVEDFNGRWNLRVTNEPRGRAWWLEVSGAGTPQVKGRFIGGPGGGMDDISAVRIEGSDLVWEVKRSDQHTGYRARLNGAELVGSRVMPATPRMEFAGKRAPAILEKDDGTWRPGSPVELFNGKDLAGFASASPGTVGIQWDVRDGILKNRENADDLRTKATYWNFQLHIEFRLAARSNSGIGLRGRYEVQVLDDAGRPPDKGSNGAIYSRIVPTENASKPAGEWQTFDITLIGREVSVVLNGKRIIDHKEIEGLTAMAHDPNEAEPGPIEVQGDHGAIEIRKMTLTPLSKR